MINLNEKDFKFAINVVDNNTVSLQIVGGDIYCIMAVSGNLVSKQTLVKHINIVAINIRKSVIEFELYDTDLKDFLMEFLKYEINGSELDIDNDPNCSLEHYFSSAKRRTVKRKMKGITTKGFSIYTKLVRMESTETGVCCSISDSFGRTNFVKWVLINEEQPCLNLVVREIVLLKDDAGDDAMFGQIKDWEYPDTEKSINRAERKFWNISLKIALTEGNICITFRNKIYNNIWRYPKNLKPDAKVFESFLVSKPAPAKIEESNAEISLKYITIPELNRRIYFMVMLTEDFFRKYIICVENGSNIEHVIGTGYISEYDDDRSVDTVCSSVRDTILNIMNGNAHEYINIFTPGKLGTCWGLGKNAFNRDIKIALSTIFPNFGFNFKFGE